MSVEVKICGLKDSRAVAAAVEGGAGLVGFVFFPASPRYVPPSLAASLAASVADGVLRVGLVVDADDATIQEILQRVSLDLLQLHGTESPVRVADIRDRFGVPVMKAIAVAHEADLESAAEYARVSDRLLFDARAPTGATRPGGNARRFDWRLLAGHTWPVPWLLAGGLEARNVAEAVRLSGAKAVDVSSGVEEGTGEKSPAKIRAFLAAAARIDRSPAAVP